MPTMTETPETPEGEYYQADLLGLAVVNEQDEPLGKVAGVFFNGGHEVLRVRQPQGDRQLERLLPFVPTVVKSVDMASGLIRVDWGSDW